ncbi:MAG: hypothetical protein LJF06_02850 [Gemmatimonadetes bacterium]|jgi:hypothetical protein|nr:hypothetical protein [Gemmatimonadota bacterium]
MRTFAAIAMAGVAGVVLFKLVTALVFPLLGLFVGLLAMTVKLALIAAVIFFVYSMIKKRKEAEAD